VEWVCFGNDGGVKMGKIKRNDAIYLEIESFADYELTQCVAYEMAIRNKHVIELKQDIDTKLELVKNEFLYARDNDTKLTLEYDLLEDEYFNKYDDDEINNDNLEKPDFHKYFIEHNENSKIVSKNLEILLNEYWVRYFYQKDIIFKSLNFNDALIQDYENIERLRENGLIGNFSSIRHNKEQDRIVEYDSFKQKKEVDINKTLIAQRLNSLVIPKKYDKRLDIKINLALPENELIAYIKILKKNFEIDFEMIKTSHEIMNNVLCQIESKHHINKAQKYADMFFIYDALKCKMTQRQIQNEIFNYYADKGIETKTMDAKTLKKYREIAIDYIDNERYKELVTGVKMGI
jgi:hypothetical protein